jgi:hypothetical protein
MALTTIQTNNKLIKFTKQVNREWVRENLFAPYMGEDITAIIRKRMELTSGGEQMNIPLVARLNATRDRLRHAGRQRRDVDNYGMRAWLDWARNAVKTNKAEKQKDSAAIFDIARPLLSDWLKELTRDEIVDAFYALVGIGAGRPQLRGWPARQRHPVRRRDGCPAQYLGRGQRRPRAVRQARVELLGDLRDRDREPRYHGRQVQPRRHAAAQAHRPRREPERSARSNTDGKEYFVAFHGSRTFRDLKTDLETINKDARPREGNGVSKNPIFQDGDLLDDGVIHREIPEIDTRAPTFYTTAGNGGTTAVRPVWLCGQSAMVMAYGQMAKPTQLDNTDYGFNQGVGIETAYGIGKMFKKTKGGLLKEWGIATAFFAAAADS